MNRFARSLVASLMVAGSASMAATTTIDFDGTGAPCVFANQVPLTTQYSGLGVTFQAFGGPEMEVLNQCGGFGFNARSGTDFLAYNVSVTSLTFDAIFSSSVSSASIWAASAFVGTFGLEAYDASNTLIDSDSVSATTTWQQLSVSATGIAYLRLIGAPNFGAFDDLSFDAADAVPEPTVLALLGLGLLGVAHSRRRSQRA